MTHNKAECHPQHCTVTLPLFGCGPDLLDNCIDHIPRSTFAIEGELGALRAREAWGESRPTEWADVARVARESGAAVYLGMIFGFIVERDAYIHNAEATHILRGALFPR